MAKRTIKNDIGHRETDALLSDLEKKIKKEYTQAAKEIEEKSLEFLEQFKEKELQKWKDYKAGRITRDEFNQWRANQILISRRWQTMRQTLAEDIAYTGAKARSIAYDYSPEAYAINANYQAYMIEHDAKIDTSFTLYDRQTVENLIKNNEVSLLKPPEEGSPAYKKWINSSTRWNEQHLTSAVVQGVLQGESIPRIAKRMRGVTDMDYRASIRNARTAITNAQNQGRIDGMTRAKNMGINLQKQWLATLDSRTRHEHRILDGQRVPIDEPFNVDGYEIDYPGDPSAEAFLVYNCRCTLVSAIKGFEKQITDLDLTQDEKLGGMSYEQWKHAKEEKG